MYWIALALLAVGAAFDLRRREIPDAIPVALFALALGMKVMGLHPVSWSGVLLGAGVAFAGSAVAFHFGALGGGDVKLLTALGAALGIGALIPFVVLTSIFGGLLALRARLREETEVAYAPAMLAGLLSLVPLVWIYR